MYYKWILSSNPCMICSALSSQIYMQIPQRPHSFCQCSFVSVGNTNGANCLGLGVEIMSMTRVRTESDYPAMGMLEDYSDYHLIHEWEVEGICPDGTMATVFVTVEFTGNDLQEAISELDEEWTSGGDGNISGAKLEFDSMAIATSKAMSLLEDECPPCADNINS